MPLKDLKLISRYRSYENDISEDFLVKCFNEAITYDRATGYFTSTFFKEVSSGIEKFINNYGKIRLITSPQLSDEDLDAIVTGLNSREEVIEKSLLKDFKISKKDIEEDTLNVVAWMIEFGILEIKICTVKESHGIFHDKFGIFTDSNDDKVVFIGSLNETYNGVRENSESIEVFTSWTIKDRVETRVNDFNLIWNNQDKHLNIFDFPEAVKQEVLKYKNNDKIPKFIEKIIEEEKNRRFVMPGYLEIRDYQKEAFTAWKESRYKGILEMATGTGKTVTALYILSELYKVALEKKAKTIFLVICPLKHLVKQWGEEFENFRVSTVNCFSDNRFWRNELRSKITEYNLGIESNLNIIVTQDTFMTKDFKEIFKKLNSTTNLLVIVDECHNIGTENFNNSYNELIKTENILALSATPDRQNDERGNEIISNIAGETVFRYTMEEAIENGFLTRYYYYPVLVELTDTEKAEYFNLTRKINKIIASTKDEDEKNEGLEILLIKRSRIIQLAQNKLIKLRELLLKQGKIKNSLIYVGAGKRETDDVREILQIVDMLNNEIGIKAEKFTSEEDKYKREDILEKFTRQELDAIVAIKCLDEGVNIPTIETAYILGSTTNIREYIQRRGRILRLYKDKNYAFIYDFIVVPTNYNEVPLLPSDIFNDERRLLKRELERVAEYASLCENRYTYLDVDELYEYKKSFNLLDI